MTASTETKCLVLHMMDSENHNYNHKSEIFEDQVTQGYSNPS